MKRSNLGKLKYLFVPQYYTNGFILNNTGFVLPKYALESWRYKNSPTMYLDIMYNSKYFSCMSS